MNYQNIYDQIIDRARTGNRLYGVGTYYERHHIVPICLGGEGKVTQWRTHPNIVVLTAREHFICHWLLCRIYPENRKLAHAFWFMSKQKSTNQERLYKVSSRTYAEAVSNIRFTEEHKEKISKWRRGRKTVVHPLTKEIKYVVEQDLQIWLNQGWENTNYRKGNRGRITEEGRQKLREARKKDQTGKTGLLAKAAKGPYTVEFNSGEKHTAGSYPELVKLTQFPYSPLLYRMKKNPNCFESGWKIYRS